MCEMTMNASSLDPAGRCIQLSNRVQKILQDLQDDSGLASLLLEKLKRWSSQLGPLEDQLRQSRSLSSAAHEIDDATTVFSLLTSGMDETINSLDGLLRDVPRAQRLSAVGKLETRLSYHTESTSLMSNYLERESSMHAPNPTVWLDKARGKWIEQKAQLEARLKDAFQCSASTLLNNEPASELEVSRARMLSSTNTTTSARPALATFLPLLQLGGEALSPGFPHKATTELIIRVSIYLLATLRTAPETSLTDNFEDSKATRLLTHLYKCAWIVHCLVNHSVLRTSGGGIKEVVAMILEELTTILSLSDPKLRASPAPTLLMSSDFMIQDPFGESWETAESSATSGSQTDEESQRSLSGSIPSPRTSSRNPPSAQNRDDELPRTESATSMFYELSASPLEKVVSIDTTYFNSQVHLEQQRWTSSLARVFKDQSRIDGNFRILICRGQSCVVELSINPNLAEIVPGYAFRLERPTLWFRQAGHEEPLHFSTSMSDFAGLAGFQSLFTGDDFESHFPTIKHARFEASRSAACLEFSNPTVQIWTARPIDARGPSSPTLQHRQTSTSNVLSLNNPLESVEAIGGQLEVSRIQFFCDGSIYTVFVNDQVNANVAYGDITLCHASDGTPLTIHITRGGKDHPAGIPLKRNAMFAESGTTKRSREFHTIQLKIPGHDAKEAFIKEFNKCRDKWLRKSMQMRTRRELQRNPIIEPKSHFNSP